MIKDNNNKYNNRWLIINILGFVKAYNEGKNPGVKCDLNS